MMLVVPVGQGGSAVQQHGVAGFEMAGLAVSQQEEEGGAQAAGGKVISAPDFVRGYAITQSKRPLAPIIPAVRRIPGPGGCCHNNPGRCNDDRWRWPRTTCGFPGVVWPRVAGLCGKKASANLINRQKAGGLWASTSCANDKQPVDADADVPVCKLPACRLRFLRAPAGL